MIGDLYSEGRQVFAGFFAPTLKSVAHEQQVQKPGGLFPIKEQAAYVNTLNEL
ncbi:hypothetical protein HNQ91_002819 [Filimonas zeae]|nr:hypothetical protein [Filimonas zeae]